MIEVAFIVAMIALAILGAATLAMFLTDLTDKVRRWWRNKIRRRSTVLLGDRVTRFGGRR